MAKERLAMRNIYVLFQQYFEHNKSPRQIRKSLGVGRTTVQDYIKRAKAAGLTEWVQIAPLSESALEEKLGFKCSGQYLI